MSKYNSNKLTNSTDDQHLLRPATLWGIPFVAEVLPIFENNYPDDSRPRQSLAVATKYVQGEKRGQVSASSRIEQLTPINFEHFRSQTCSDDVSFGS